jgi:type IV pilus assembly protein PilQ
MQTGNVIRIAPLETLRKESLADLDAQRGKEEKEPTVTELIPVNYATAKEILPQNVVHDGGMYLGSRK